MYSENKTPPIDITVKATYQQTDYVTKTLPTGCILVRSVLTLSACEGHIPMLSIFIRL